ncbi:MAG TPA: hypothetical protein VM658_04475 [bacterium]|nr:hypothetical protein [bacterium]
MSIPKDKVTSLPARGAGDKSEPGREELIRERNRWFYSLTVVRKQEKLFELEVFLKGLDRFFNLANQPISQREGVVNRDFSRELRIIRNAVARVVKLTQGLLTEEENKALHFQSYIEGRLLSDFHRARHIERALLQRTPEESLYVLCGAFINFQEILQAVLVQPKNSYAIFYNIEQLIGREIAGNRFFNPFKAAGFAPHYDVIKSPRFTRLARAIGDPVLRKHLSVIFLLMFKLLRYLSFVDVKAKDIERLKDCLLIFALVHSECRMLVDLLERELPPVIKKREYLPRETRTALLENMDALAYQITVEIRKMFELELKDAAQVTELNPFRIGVIRSRGLLTNIFQQGIIQMGLIVDPELSGKDVFPDFISRLEESLKLRRDIWLFHKVIENTERVMEDGELKNETIPMMESVKTLRNFIFYYQNISFQFVRAYDREHFQKFFEKVDVFQMADLEVAEKRAEFKREIHGFKMFLETTLANINNRAELHDMPFGAEEGERILAQFLS